MSKFSKFVKDFSDGVVNLVFSKNQTLNAMAKERIKEHCLNCPLLLSTTVNGKTIYTCNPLKKAPHSKTDKMTSGCGCNLNLKAIAPRAECPLGKWEVYKGETDYLLKQKDKNAKSK